ncbi:MAG: hypothetical protein IT215_02450, partial [Chitinophagaceae bacterium]|nr:hypothetical protein [Chitinophagaceae bacterium]
MKDNIFTPNNMSKEDLIKHALYVLKSFKLVTEELQSNSEVNERVSDVFNEMLSSISYKFINPADDFYKFFELNENSFDLLMESQKKDDITYFELVYKTRTCSIAGFNKLILFTYLLFVHLILRERRFVDLLEEEKLQLVISVFNEKKSNIQDTIVNLLNSTQNAHEIINQAPRILDSESKQTITIESKFNEGKERELQRINELVKENERLE